MLDNVKQLRLSDLILKRRGTLAFRMILAAFGIALRLFFRRVETVNADRVPSKCGVIFVMNHPNGLIDPALVFVALPRKISFLAKSTLFRMPVISFILRAVEALPLYRKIDAGEDVSKNQQTFELCRELLKKGGSIALFPEGVSHNSPKLLPAKTGAARIALGAVSVGEHPDALSLSIVPVGLYYTSKTTLRSEALLHFGESFPVARIDLDAEGQPPRDAVKELTAKIEDALRDVTLNAESEGELHTAHIAQEIFASAATNENLGEKLEFLQTYIEESTGDKCSVEDMELAGRLHEYDEKLDDLGIEPVHLSLSQFSQSFVVKQAFFQIWPLVVLLPFSIVGVILHFPAYQLCKYLAYVYTRHGEDDIASTVKVLAAMVFMPLTWIITAIVVYFFFGWTIALVSIPVAFACGYIALYSLEEFEELRGWTKAVWLFLTRREKFLRLFVERRELLEDLREFD
jgi:1-acyl-sn-glycerol-3-phosphate acyltransferase